MAIRARIVQEGRILTVYIDDPSLAGRDLGPRGNHVRVSYDIDGNRVRYEGAVRGYGEAGHDIVARAVALADRAAAKIDIAKGGPSEPVQRFTANL